ncbi:Sm-like protein LSM1B [Vitis vinifera]|uniref:Sm-like protein LSM1B n=1 Tax=Vitis vinifera TaxID=29760 RepID=A0A438J9H7_VITVI|nr:Sm-like protein LSM1B [Vitis vinifera]
MAESSWVYFVLSINLFSFPYTANAVLEGACERAIVGDIYCDIPLGLYVIRGENVVLLGELDLDKEELPPHMTRVPEAEIKGHKISCFCFVFLLLISFGAHLICFQAQKAEREATDLKGSMRKRMEFLDFD